jgi:hypothetical protein
MANLATISHDFSSGAAVLNNTTALDSLMVRMDEQDLAGIKAAADAVLVAATFEGGKKEFYALLVEMCQRHGRGKSQAYLYAAAGWQGFQRIKRLGGAHLWQDADTYAEAHKTWWTTSASWLALKAGGKNRSTATPSLRRRSWPTVSPVPWTRETSRTNTRF